MAFEQLSNPEIIPLVMLCGKDVLGALEEVRAMPSDFRKAERSWLQENNYLLLNLIDDDYAFACQRQDSADARNFGAYFGSYVVHHKVNRAGLDYKQIFENFKLYWLLEARLVKLPDMGRGEVVDLDPALGQEIAEAMQNIRDEHAKVAAAKAIFLLTMPYTPVVEKYRVLK